MNSGRRAIFASIASIAASGLLLKKRWIQSLMVDSVEAASDLKTELRGTIDTAIALAQNELTLTVPAASMRSQADAFRARFVHDYLDPKNKFPIFQAMFLAQILPTNVDATHKYILSPPDMDEATAAALDLVDLNTAFGTRGTTGLDRVQAFVKGYSGGLAACG